MRDLNESLSCPACYSDKVQEISEQDKNEAFALYDIYDFVGRIDIMTNNYRCVNCGYEF